VGKLKSQEIPSEKKKQLFCDERDQILEQVPQRGCVVKTWLSMALSNRLQLLLPWVGGGLDALQMCLPASVSLWVWSRAFLSTVSGHHCTGKPFFWGTFWLLV